MSKEIKKEQSIFKNKINFYIFLILAAFLIINSFLIPNVFASIIFGGSSTGSINLGDFQYGSKITLKPMPLASGEQPAIAGYKTKVKSLPTISEIQIKPSTGDPAKDLINNIIPSGTPWYGAEAGVSFDDPKTAQQLWIRGGAIQLSTEEQNRWARIVNSFTCDYCCGSPKDPTIITQCGCAHSKAAQGMSKWFIKNYGNKYSDEEIYGEMARWYAVWYPGPTVKRILEESQN
ncbi:hypothetical protein HYU23_04480 [Candidatus Woesearchaeota archaeon]|nr:hypothetical protein [Candidatus Woesearchaeota archaeon]